VVHGGGDGHEGVSAQQNKDRRSGETIRSGPFQVSRGGCVGVLLIGGRAGGAWLKRVDMAQGRSRKGTSSQKSLLLVGAWCQWAEGSYQGGRECTEVHNDLQKTQDKGSWRAGRERLSGEEAGGSACVRGSAGSPTEVATPRGKEGNNGPPVPYREGHRCNSSQKGLGGPGKAQGKRVNPFDRTRAKGGKSKEVGWGGANRVFPVRAAASQKETGRANTGQKAGALPGAAEVSGKHNAGVDEAKEERCYRTQAEGTGQGHLPPGRPDSGTSLFGASRARAPGGQQMVAECRRYGEDYQGSDRRGGRIKQGVPRRNEGVRSANATPEWSGGDGAVRLPPKRDAHGQ